MAQKYIAPFGRCVARRLYYTRLRSGRLRMVSVEIGTPAEVPGSDWGCRVRIKGLSSPIDRTVFGIDSIQALEVALMYSGKTLSSSSEFRAGKLEIWNKPAKNVFELALPLPLYALQSSLGSVQNLLERLRAGRTVERDWKRGMLIVMREVATSLALQPVRSRRLSKS